LLVDTVDKLIFIYMNYQALRKLKEDELSDNELLAVEDRFMG
jgi:hypothetical protein